MASLTNGWKLFSTAALTAAMLFTAVPAKAEAIPDGGTFTVTWAQNPVSLNPGLSSGISSGMGRWSRTAPVDATKAEAA